MAGIGQKKGFKFTEESKKKMRESYRLYAQKNGHNILKNHFSWKGKKLSEEHKKKLSEAKMGGKSFWFGKKMPLEVRKKISQSNLGNLKIKDRSLVKKHNNRRGDADNKIWRASVYRRDNWKCKINDVFCCGRIEAHHIFSWRDYPELRYDINNGITLCHFHHPIKKEKVIKLADFFTKLITK